MPTVNPTPATLLPTPPTTADPSTFDFRADATLLAQQAMVPQVNQLALDTYQNALEAQSSAASALASKDAAASTAASINANAASAAAAASASAAASAATAQNAAAAAEIASAADKWVSGTTYENGYVAWSPINSQVYRRKGTGAGTTDPSVDPINYEPVTGIKPAVVIVSAAANAQKFTLHVFVASAPLVLPASPNPGDWVSFSNRSGTATPVIVRNGQPIMGHAKDMVVDGLNYFGTLVFINGFCGWVFN